MQSLTNSMLKQLKEKKYRDKDELFIVEGIKSLMLVPKSYDILYYVAAHSFKDYHLLRENVQIYTTSDSKFKQLCDTKSPQGIFGVLPFYKNTLTKENIQKNGFYIFLENINDPGNLGTIIRTADAFSISGIILSEGSVSLYNPKVIRSTMGSMFHIPIYENASLEKTIFLFKDMCYNVICGSLDGNTAPYEYDYKEPTVLLIGNEAKGLTDKAISYASEKIKIPITGSAESLNISVAASIFMYEFMKGRLK